MRIAHRLACIEEREQLSYLAANDGLWDFDIERNDVYFSPRWKAMLGYEDADLVGAVDWRGLVHPDDMARVQEAIRDHVAGKTADLREHAPHAPPQRRMALGHQPRQGAGR